MLKWLSLLALCSAIPGSASEKVVCTRAKTSPVVSSLAVREASGAAFSRKHPQWIWAVNDSGSRPQLHRVGLNGADGGTVTLDGAFNRDWEDLASFTHQGRDMLLVADTGDNAASRSHATLYFLEEPPPPAKNRTITARITERRHFRFEGGPRDCESVAVDIAEGRILLITKRTHPPELHELDLGTNHSKEMPVTRRTGTVRLPQHADRFIPFGRQPTGLDIAEDGSAAVLLTYGGVWLYRRKPGESWATAFDREPVALPAHRLPQAEAIALGRPDQGIVVLSEGVRQTMARYHWPEKSQ